MRPISHIFTALLMVVLTTTMTLAQNNPYGDNYRNEKPSTGRSRPIRHCTESYSNKFFNRDFGALGNSNMYHLANELQSYVKYKCCTSEQIRRLAGLFQTDRDKYDFLVYSLNYVYDLETYATTGTVLANRNAREGFYRFLVREGIPAGDYYNDYYANTGYYAPPPVYVQPRQNPNDNSYNNYPDPRYNNSNQNNNNNQTPQYNNGNNQNNNSFEPNNNGNNNQNNSGNYQNNNGNNQNTGGVSQTNSTYRRNDNAYPEVNSKGVNAGYQGLMTYKEFANMKERIKQNSLEAGKLEAAKAMTRENILTAIQIADITRLLIFDNNRLDYAKFAFEFTYDRENYTVVSDALAFQKNREDLLRFTQQQKR
jgi:hypothetical protein